MTLPTRARRALLSLSAIIALGATTAATADAALSIRGTTPDPGLRYYLQTRPDDATTITNKQKNAGDLNQRWAQTTLASGSVFKNEVGACLVDFGFSLDGSVVRANPCDRFSATSHFHWDVLPGTVESLKATARW
jgi:hypothetical protein